MRLATILTLGVSAVLGAGALFGARAWLPSAKAEDGPAATVPVVAARAAIPYGARLTPADLTLVRLPADAAPQGAFASIAEVTALDDGAPMSLAAIAPREPVLPSMVSGAGARPSLAAMISPGMRAYTIPVGDVAGGGGHVLPGDRVDVVMARQLGQDQGDVVVDVVLQDVRVLGMNLNADPASTEKAEPHTATLEVGVEDAGRLSVAVKAGVLSLALRRTGAQEVEPIGAIRTADLAAGAPRPAASRAVRRPSRAAPRAGQGLVIVHGDKAAVVHVPADRKGAGA